MNSLDISYLFVPGSRPERYEKALGSGADAVIIDLEDAVSPDQKDSARNTLMHALEDSLSSAVWVRINAAETAWFKSDLEALAELNTLGRNRLRGVMVPTTEDPESLEAIAGKLPGVNIIALLETAQGISRLSEIARAPGLVRLALGGADLSVDLDIEIQSSTMDWVYAQVVVASKAAQLPGPIASPPFEIHNPRAIESEAMRLRGMGMKSQLCIHPAQVVPIHRGFSPSEDEVEWAERIVASAVEGAAQVDGQMVDKPVIEKAQQILQRTRGVGKSPVARSVK